METTNTNRSGLIGVIAILLIIIIGAGAYLYYNKAMAPSQLSPDEADKETVASGCGLTVTSPQIGANVSMPVTISGTINNTNTEEAGCSWTMFEGQGGTAQLFYETKDGWSLPVDTKPIMVADWMTTSTTFSVSLDFDNTMLQLPAGYNFKILLTEENPSGEGTPDVVEIPVVLQ